jgi:hypothetical protein
MYNNNIDFCIKYLNIKLGIQQNQNCNNWIKNDYFKNNIYSEMRTNVNTKGVYKFINFFHALI